MLAFNGATYLRRKYQSLDTFLVDEFESNVIPVLGLDGLDDVGLGLPG